MLFGDESDKGAHQDRQTIYGLLTGFCAQFPEYHFQLDDNAINGVVFSMRIGFPHKGGFNDASPFKKAANFVCHWVAAAPIKTQDSAPCQHINAVFALLVAGRSLNRATLSTDGNSPQSTKLENSIELSKHSFWDIAEALSTATPQQSFKLVSVLLEQLAYKTNAQCQYQTFAIGGAEGISLFN